MHAPSGVLAQPGQWVRALIDAPFFGEGRLYYVHEVVGDRIRYGLRPDSRATALGPDPEAYTIIPGEPQSWHRHQPMFGYTGIKSFDDEDCLRGFWVLEISDSGECWCSTGPYDSFAQAKEHMDDKYEGNYYYHSQA